MLDCSAVQGSGTRGSTWRTPPASERSPIRLRPTRRSRVCRSYAVTTGIHSPRPPPASVPRPARGDLYAVRLVRRDRRHHTLGQRSRRRCRTSGRRHDPAPEPHRTGGSGRGRRARTSARRTSTADRGSRGASRTVASGMRSSAGAQPTGARSISARYPATADPRARAQRVQRGVLPPSERIAGRRLSLRRRLFAPKRTGWSRMARNDAVEFGKGCRTVSHDPDVRVLDGWCAGQSAVVTGAAHGIGLATARLLGRAGANVVVVDSDERTLQDAWSDGAAAPVVGDLSAEDVGDLADGSSNATDQSSSSSTTSASPPGMTSLPSTPGTSIVCSPPTSADRGSSPARWCGG